MIDKMNAQIDIIVFFVVKICNIQQTTIYANIKYNT
nr:MAG TPA: hypothetical protein [Caudoviricetes sp.]